MFTATTPTITPAMGAKISPMIVRLILHFLWQGFVGHSYVSGQQ
jgi:hypothetical protein